MSYLDRGTSVLHKAPPTAPPSGRLVPALSTTLVNTGGLQFQLQTSHRCGRGYQSRVKGHALIYFLFGD